MLQFAEPPFDFPPQHYAFLVDDEHFERVYARITERGLEHWADPQRTKPGECQHRAWRARGLPAGSDRDTTSSSSPGPTSKTGELGRAPDDRIRPGHTRMRWVRRARRPRNLACPDTRSSGCSISSRYIFPANQAATPTMGEAMPAMTKIAQMGMTEANGPASAMDTGISASETKKSSEETRPSMCGGTRRCRSVPQMTCPRPPVMPTTTSRAASCHGVRGQCR